MKNTKVLFCILFVFLLCISAGLTGCSGQTNDDKQSVETSQGNTSNISRPLIVQNPQVYVVRGSAGTDGKCTSLPSYDPNSPKGGQVDIRGLDLRSLDLTGRENDLLNSVFDSNTKWPQSLPNNFDPYEIMNIGMNPGLGTEKLHEDGITGTGIGIAIIDYPLIYDHEEYAGRVKMYEEINPYGKMTYMTAPMVASLAAGKNCGTAPEANLYFIGSSFLNKTSGTQSEIDFSWYAQAVDRIVDVNRILPEDQKIRVLCIATPCWSPEMKGYDKITESVKKAAGENIFVVSNNIFETYNGKYYFAGLTTDTLSDRDNPSSYKVIPWDKWIYGVSKVGKFGEYFEKKFDENQPKEILLIPAEGRTAASSSGKTVYSYYRDGSWSMVTPYIAGLYALCCQVKPDVTPDIFWIIALETGDSRTITRNGKDYTGKIVNPQKLIESLERMK